MATHGGTALVRRQGDGDGAGDGADFSIGEAATLVGVSPHTIRAWERRQKVVAPRRTASKQRRYSADEVEALRRLRRDTAMRGPAVTTAARRRASSGVEGGPALDMSLWRGLADLLPILVLILEGGSILDTNVAVARLTGTLRERLRGRRFLDIVEPFDRAKAVIACLSPLRQCRASELHLRAARGTSRFSFDFHPVWEEGRELLVMVGRPLPLP